MDKISLTETLALSRIVYGMWRLGDDADTSPAHVRAKIDACLDQGITSFDHADIYGDYGAEGIFGTAMREAAPSLRDQIEIVTKCDIVAPIGRYADRPVKHYDTSRAHILLSVETSLRELATDRIDLLLIHRPDPFMDPHETGAALDEVVASGKVRAVGVSNFRPWDWKLLQSAMKTPLVTNQIEISLSRLSPFTDGDLSFHQRHAHPVMAWSPLGGGALMTGTGTAQEVLDEIAAAQGVDRAAVATAFLLAHPARIIPVMGTNTLSRIAKLSDALKVTLDRETWFRLYQAGLGQEVP
ncbi:oxidoreductase [Thioclava dalianensis]|uniref:Oxidoreductase n=1 Tax=Thioclava dalianensis TaxID=1185766 RepID=A0A074TIB2_9RHOB|nr:aldo/keto reductase [Thioclava dalianensis]KEP71379.1 oxidoreductase [Thioclava dalianensis]SFM78662.1 Predicted oxidoreductase [Thioclava dalianensis]